MSAGLTRVHDALGRPRSGALVWPAAAGLLGITGGRFHRRAALRGLVAATLASVVTNGPVRLVVGWRRPAGRRDSPPSILSGHAAAGFGFAVGAGQEAPALTVPLLGVATLVGYARARSDAHHPADAAVGAALGIAAGLATRRLWPVAPREQARPRVAPKAAAVGPSPTGKGLVVVVNSLAGSADQVTDELHAELPEAEVAEIDDGADLESALRSAAERGVAIGVIGGDGSINTAAAIAAETATPLFVAPGGTLNHFAYALGLESLADATRAVREGRVVEVDRAVIDGHTFVNTASIGSYVELVDAREELESRIGKWPAVLVALVGVLRQAAPVDVELDGVRRRVWMVFIGNCRYQPSGFAPSWRERVDDGELDVRIVDGSKPWSRFRLLLSVLTGRLGSCRAYEQRYVQSLTVRSLDGPLRLARDGETFEGPEEFTIAKADEPLLVYVPEP